MILSQSGCMWFKFTTLNGLVSCSRYRSDKQAKATLLAPLPEYGDTAITGLQAQVVEGNGARPSYRQRTVCGKLQAPGDARPEDYARIVSAHCQCHERGRVGSVSRPDKDQR
jgi:hypothetical protein